MNHEKLNCYQQLLEIAGQLSKAVYRWPKGYAYLADQLKRAISSALLNLAEGNGKRSQAERKRFFQISLGSLAEVSACLDLCSSFSLFKPFDIAEFKEGIRQVYCQIRKLP